MGWDDWTFRESTIEIRGFVKDQVALDWCVGEAEPAVFVDQRFLLLVGVGFFCFIIYYYFWTHEIYLSWFFDCSSRRFWIFKFDENIWLLSAWFLINWLFNILNLTIFTLKEWTQILNIIPFLIKASDEYFIINYSLLIFLFLFFFNFPDETIH